MNCATFEPNCLFDESISAFPLDNSVTGLRFRSFTPTTMSKGERIGTLIVVVLKAKNLIDRHSFYKQDVFCQISLNGAHSVGGKGVRKGH